MEHFFDQITQYGIWWAYGFLFVSAIGENLFPPVPGDTVTLIGAAFVGMGKLDFAGVLISTTLGSVVGFLALFGLAYRLGWGFFEEKNWKWLETAQIRKVETWFARYGYSIIFANRFLPGVRSVISISAGLSNLSIWKTTVYATVSAFLWNGIIIYLGAFIGKSWETILEYVQLYNRTFLILLAVVAGAYIIYRIFKRKAGK